MKKAINLLCRIFSHRWESDNPCLVHHHKSVEKNMSKEFATKEEAQTFIDNAPEDIKKTMKLKEIVDRSGEAR